MAVADPVDVSVVIPSHNDAATLGEQLDAVLAQVGAGTFEVIVVDDASTDDTADVVTSRTDRDERIVTIRTGDTPRGPAFARNRGTERARAPRIAYCDGDDVVAAGWLAALSEALDDAELVGGRLEHALVNPASTQLWRGEAAMTGLPTTLAFLPYAISANCAVKRAAWERVGGWDETLPGSEDVDLSWRIQLNGGRIEFAPEAVVHYRHRGTIAETWQQAVAYGRHEVALFATYRVHGARPRAWRHVLSRYVYLVTRTPYLLGNRTRRGLWIVVAAGLYGRFRGSLRHRVICL